VKDLRLSINEKALELVKEAIEKSYELNLNVEKHPSGATIIDAGIKACGSYAAGKIITEICLGGLGKATVTFISYGTIALPAIYVETGRPAIATLGAQLAGWRLKIEDYFAMGSGPARALALKPRDLYEEIGYRDDAESAVLVLEAEATPPRNVLNYIANECKVKLENLYIIVAPTASLAGAVQISGRVVETGIHKLSKIGLDPKKIVHGCGCAPIAPIHPKAAKAMGRTNDSLIFAGIAYYTVDYEDDEELREIVKEAPSSASKDYGKPFYELFEEADFDFYKIDPNLFAPAMIFVNNIKSGVTYKAGKINVEALKQSMNIVES
jgi:methenyltetrahydromethanopterin cyclohydrolase